MNDVSEEVDIYEFLQPVGSPSAKSKQSPSNTAAKSVAPEQVQVDSQTEETNIYDFLTPVGEKSPSEKGFIEEGIGMLGAGARGIPEGFIGQAGDLAKAARTGIEAMDAEPEFYEPSNIAYQASKLLPTREQVAQASDVVFGETEYPEARRIGQNIGGFINLGRQYAVKGTKELAKNFPSFKSMAKTMWKEMPKALKKPLAIIGLSETGGYGVEKATGSKEAGDITRATLAFGAAMYSPKAFEARGNSLYKRFEDSIPKGASLKTSPIAQAVSNYDKSIKYSGGKGLESLKEYNNLLQNLEDNVLSQKSLDPTAIRKLNTTFNDALNKVKPNSEGYRTIAALKEEVMQKMGSQISQLKGGKEANKYFSEATSFWRTGKQAAASRDFIERNLENPFVRDLMLYGAVQGNPLAAGTKAGYLGYKAMKGGAGQVSQTLEQIMTNKHHAELWAKIITNAMKGDAGLMNKYSEDLQKSLQSTLPKELQDKTMKTQLKKGYQQ